jgi:hypothetical protein
MSFCKKNKSNSHKKGDLEKTQNLNLSETKIPPPKKSSECESNIKQRLEKIPPLIKTTWNLNINGRKSSEYLKSCLPDLNFHFFVSDKHVLDKIKTPELKPTLNKRRFTEAIESKTEASPHLIKKHKKLNSFVDLEKNHFEINETFSEKSNRSKVNCVNSLELNRRCNKSGFFFSNLSLKDTKLKTKSNYLIICFQN